MGEYQQKALYGQKTSSFLFETHVTRDKAQKNRKNVQF